MHMHSLNASYSTVGITLVIRECNNHKMFQSSPCFKTALLYCYSCLFVVLTFCLNHLSHNVVTFTGKPVVSYCNNWSYGDVV